MKKAWLVLLLVCGCSSAPIEMDAPVPASFELKHNQRLTGGLGVSIRVFESALADPGLRDAASAEVRSVEHRYLPYVLKQTLDQSGFWGAVRVLPASDPGAEVSVRGKIIHSSGSHLSLQVTVVDSTMRTWFSREYHDAAHDLDYAADPNYLSDPFQDIFNQIANDMSSFLAAGVAASEITSVAELRYGVALSPEVFNRFLSKSAEGFWQIAALPAESDPVLENIRRIRESEYLFADSVDAHYENLYRKLGPTYAWWRHYYYELKSGNERLGKIDPTRGASDGSWYAMERIYKTYKESKMNEDALRQLTASFDSETRPIVADISGRLVELEGTLEHQYRTWRRLLRAYY